MHNISILLLHICIDMDAEFLYSYIYYFHVGFVLIEHKLSFCFDPLVGGGGDGGGCVSFCFVRVRALFGCSACVLLVYTVKKN